jgi:hypothetical protein
VLVEMWIACGERMAANPGPSATAASALSSGKRGHRHLAGREIGELCRSAGAAQRRCPLRVSVIDEHLMTVFNEIDGKSLSHMAQTDHSDTCDHEFGGFRRCTRYGGRSGHEFPRWQEGGRCAGQLASTNGQAAASISYPVDFAMNSSRVWQTIANGARPRADALISAFRW